jgi:hypothetical protein
MASTIQRAVRLERQPHREAVQRLRQAYEVLRQLAELRSARVASDPEAEIAPDAVQEVRK